MFKRAAGSRSLAAARSNMIVEARPIMAITGHVEISISVSLSARSRRARSDDAHDLHYGLAGAKWQQRAEVLRAAYHAHPERFPHGVPVPPLLPTAAWINKPPASLVLAGPAGAGS